MDSNTPCREATPEERWLAEQVAELRRELTATSKAVRQFQAALQEVNELLQSLKP